jgi:hypothetical protein
MILPAQTRIRFVLFAIGLILFLASYYALLRPIINFDSDDIRHEAALRAVTSSTLRALRDADSRGAVDEVAKNLEQIFPVVLLPVGPLASARVHLRFDVVAKQEVVPRPNVAAETDTPYQLVVAPGEPMLRINWDILIWSAGGLIVAVIAFRTTRVRPIAQVTAQDSRPAREKKTPQSSSASLASIEGYLVTDVDRALTRSEQLFSRSTLLLVGGVVMAFVGVGVFFASLTEVNAVSPDQNIVVSSTPINRQLFLAFKSTAMLVFLEAIAWFLLRQYRALIEDYKSFYRYYMRRANYLAAFKMVSHQADKVLIGRLVETLLSEDLTGRLKQGETTELLEGQRANRCNVTNGDPYYPPPIPSISSDVTHVTPVTRVRRVRE